MWILPAKFICCRRTESGNVQTPPEQAHEMNALRDLIRTFETATNDHTLVKIKKNDLAALKASFECCICKGQYCDYNGLPN